MLTLSKLDHENIVKYKDSFEYDQCLYIVTEFCEEGDLAGYIQKLKE